MIPKGISPKDYRKVHHFIRKQKGKASFCAVDKSHISKRFEWANISGKYLEDVMDFESLCVSCHRKKDIKPDTIQKLRQSHLGQISHRKKEISQLTIQGKFVKHYESLTKAANDTGILITSICNALSKKSNHAGGYIWKYI